MYSPKFTNMSKTKIIIFFSFIHQQVYMLPVKLLKPHHVTSYHIKPLNRGSTRFIVKAVSCSYAYLANSSYCLNILEMSKHMKRFSNVSASKFNNSNINERS